jgi:hypothetical protein
VCAHISLSAGTQSIIEVEVHDDGCQHTSTWESVRLEIRNGNKTMYVFAAGGGAFIHDQSTIDDRKRQKHKEELLIS